MLNFLFSLLNSSSSSRFCKYSISSSRKNIFFFQNMSISLWAVVNSNSNRTCPVFTGLPDNSVYWPDPMVQYVALTRLTYDRGQFSWHSPVGGLTMKTPMASYMGVFIVIRQTFYSTRHNPRPIWPTPLT